MEKARSISCNKHTTSPKPTSARRYKRTNTPLFLHIHIHAVPTKTRWMTYISGIVAAVVSPLVTTIGFLSWEYFCFDHHPTKKNWSSFALNLYKCCLATILFIITIFILSIINFYKNNKNVATNYHLFSIATTTAHTKEQIVGYLLLSSVIGIIIGDILWLQALSRLGSVRVIFMDALKPFCATIFGILLLQEPFHYTILIGIVLTVTGILCMSMTGSHNPPSPQPEQQPPSTNSVQNEMPMADTNQSDVNDTNHNEATTKQVSRGHTMGYVMSLLNVILDTYGSVLTKQYGISISVWEINCIRFGFAGSILLVVSIVMILYHRHNHSTHQEKHMITIPPPPSPESDSSLPVTTVNATKVTSTTTATTAQEMGNGRTSDNDIPTVPWYMIPIGRNYPEMTKSVWMFISLGVVFVTFIAPTLYNYALLEISLALTLTLSSIGPFYAIPLSYAVQRYLYHRRHSAPPEDKDDDDPTRPPPEITRTMTGSRPQPAPPLLLVWVGAVLTVVGIVVLAYRGNHGR